MTMKTIQVALAAAILLLPGLAAAQDRQAARKACGPDVRRLCKGTRPGGGRLLACLRANETALSPVCREFLQSQRSGQ